MALSPVVMTTKLKDGDGNGEIESSGNVKGLGPKGSIWIFDGEVKGGFRYIPKGWVEPEPTPAPTPAPTPTPPAPDPVPPVVTPEPPVVVVPPVVTTPDPVPAPTPAPAPAPAPTPAPAPEPTPTPPSTPSAKLVEIDSEVFLQSTKVAAALNKSGTLGSRGTAPEGFLTDRAAGFIRLGMVTVPQVGGELMLKGTPVEGFSIGYKGGKTVTNSGREGIENLPGKVSVADYAVIFTAQNATLKVVQKVRLAPESDGLDFEITITNIGKGTLSDVRYMRFIDPDQDTSPDLFNTTIALVSQSPNGAKLTATASGVTFYYETLDARAVVAAIKGYQNRDPYAPAITTPAKVGTVLKGDNTAHLAFKIDSLAAGESTTLLFKMGMRK